MGKSVATPQLGDPTPTIWLHALHQALQHAATLMPPDIGIDIQEGLKLHYKTYALTHEIY